MLAPWVELENIAKPFMTRPELLWYYFQVNGLRAARQAVEKMDRLCDERRSAEFLRTTAVREAKAAQASVAEATQDTLDAGRENSDLRRKCLEETAAVQEEVATARQLQNKKAVVGQRGAVVRGASECPVG